MRTSLRLILAGGLILTALPLALAQEGNNPPQVEVIRWEVFRWGGYELVYDRDLGVGSFFDIGAYLHEELDLVVVTLEVTDADWTGGGTEGDTDDEEFFVRFTARGDYSWAPPEAPPIVGAENEFFGASSEEGFVPFPGELTREIAIIFMVPEFLGKNQSRLRGFIDFDVRWFLRFSVANEDDPENDQGVTSAFVTLLAVESPELGPLNPPAFADAGPDRTVPAGFAVILDGSRTFDSFNIGFDPGDDENVFEKDRLSFTWEWISGPVRVDPVQTDPHDPKATVTLNVVGVYEYRLIVDDNVNALPSTDAVLITVVAELPEKNPPVAIIEGPANAQPVGAIIALVSRSIDPDRPDDPNGLLLEYRWQQTDELGGPLTPEELQRTFQPLSGLTEKKSTWQALVPGTFYFRLLVDDGDFRSSARFSVEVIETETGGATETAGDGSTGSGSNGDDGASQQQEMTAPSLCGAGMLPVAAVPVALCVLRRRVR